MIDAVSVAEPTRPDVLGFINQTEALNCPDPLNADEPYCGLYYLEIFGSNLWAGDDARWGSLTFTEIGQPGAVRTEPYYIIEWSHVAIRVVSYHTSMQVRVNVESRSPSYVVQTQASEFFPFEDLAPAISGLAGAGTRFPTSGGDRATALTLQLTHMKIDRNVRILVGENECIEYLDATLDTVMTQTQLGAAVDRSSSTLSLRCVVPPGAGGVNPLSV